MLPPFIDVHIGGASKPGIQDEDATISGTTLESIFQAGVVM
jgi:hypothetical protein